LSSYLFYIFVVDVIKCTYIIIVNLDAPAVGRKTAPGFLLADNVATSYFAVGDFQLRNIAETGT
jgi:hypothetical protein